MDLFIEILSSVLILLGAFFMIVSAIGIIRLPDFYIRMSAITKAATMGLGLILFGIGIYTNQVVLVGKIMAILFFILLTSPVSAHVIARAACMNKVPFWKSTLLHEFKAYLEKFQVGKKSSNNSDPDTSK